MNASRQSFIVSAAMCALMAALFVARYCLAPYPVEASFEGGMPLAAALVRFSVAFPWLAALCVAVVVVWTLLVVIQLTVKYAPAASRNYLPPQIFLVCACGIVVSGEALPSFLAAWLLTLALRQFIFSLHKEYRFTELFHAGFYMGLIPLLYAPAAALALPVCLAALMIYRRSGREAVVCLAGLVLPVPAAGFIHLATGAEGGFIYREIWRCTTLPAAAWGSVPYSAAIPAALVVILALVAIFWVADHKKSVRKTHYKFMQHTSLTLLFVAASAFVPGASASLVPLAAVPCALCVPYAFQGKSATLSTVIYCLVVAVVLALALLPVLAVPIP